MSVSFAGTLVAFLSIAAVFGLTCGAVAALSINLNSPWWLLLMPIAWLITGLCAGPLMRLMEIAIDWGDKL